MDFHLVRTKDHYIDVIVPLKKRAFFTHVFFNDFTYFTKFVYCSLTKSAKQIPRQLQSRELVTATGPVRQNRKIGK